MSASTISRGEGVFEGVGGLQLRYRSWAPPTPSAAVLVVHGLADHSGRYDRLARELAEDGLATFALDLRGHGHSEGRRGHAPRFEVLLHEVERFRRRVQETEAGALPQFLLGHSMGGLITLRYLQEYRPPLRGAIVMSPWLRTAVAVPGWKLVLARVLDRLLPALPIPAGIPVEELCGDAGVVAAYRADPLVHGSITPRLFIEAGNAMELAFLHHDRIETPILLLYGEEDRIVDPARIAELGVALEGDATVHGFAGLRHELFNEPERGRVMETVREWVGRRGDRRGDRR